MADQLTIDDKVPRDLPRSMHSAWAMIWANFKLLRGLVGYEELTIDSVAAGTYVLPHHLGRVPTRCMVVRAYHVAYPTESARTESDITLVVSGTSATAAQLIVRVW